VSKGKHKGKSKGSLSCVRNPMRIERNPYVSLLVRKTGKGGHRDKKKELQRKGCRGCVKDDHLLHHPLNHLKTGYEI
jgi:hypothetical protein